MSYVVASYVIVLGSVLIYGASQIAARNRLRKALSAERNRDRG
jgi:hypothetical protein